ncbi:MAG TPA: site-specific integrase [Gaiellaceae bacterium]|nr:site-specific integrase [Gaiellaceae bacterium]
MASLQARHSRKCALGKPWTPADRTDGCTCSRGPLFHVVVRDGRKAHKTPVGRNRREAERALRKIAVQLDEGVYRPQANIPFEEWGRRWLDSLERKETTKDSYRSTIAYASEAFGSLPVRRLRPEHIARFGQLLRERGRDSTGKALSASTRAKHLRVLHACLASAVAHGYAGSNPVNELPKSERPRPQRKEAAYFENDELPRLFAHVEDGVHRVLFLLALKTGMRLGELLALTWGDVDLTEAVIRVRRTHTDGHLDLPKNHERRDVDLTPDVVELLGEWWGELDGPADGTLVFPAETPSGYLVGTTILRRVLYPAMEAADVPRVGPTGEKRTFHSFRHTFAKRALESGRQITWLSRHLGHSSLKVTTDVYGHWERSERKREARKMEGVFGV